MTLEQINKIIEDYESLLQLIRDKAKILLEYDPQKYYGINHADDISIEHDEVYLAELYLNNFDTWKFPLEWLSLDDESLKKTLLLTKEGLRQKELLKAANLLKANDLKDLQEFERLKKKFNT